MQVLIVGDITSGVRFIGPFVDGAAAVEYAGEHLGSGREPWTTAPIEKPIVQAPAQVDTRDIEAEMATLLGRPVKTVDALEELAVLIRGAGDPFPACQPCNTHYMCALHRKCRRE